jgi:hypothetical protein
MPNHMIIDPLLYRYNKNNDLHIQAIDKLVHELGIPAEEVNRSYREILAELRQDVEENAFLPLLTSFGVKRRLKEERKPA